MADTKRPHSQHRYARIGMSSPTMAQGPEFLERNLSENRQTRCRRTVTNSPSRFPPFRIRNRRLRRCLSCSKRKQTDTGFPVPPWVRRSDGSRICRREAGRCRVVGAAGDPGRTRTCNLSLRRGLLYPVEPRGRVGRSGPFGRVTQPSPSPGCGHAAARRIKMATPEVPEPKICVDATLSTASPR
jgi:hypothetical protein